MAFALDAFSVPLLGVEGVWVALLLAGFALVLTASYFFGHRNYLAIAVLFAILSTMIVIARTTALTFAEVWPMIPIGLSVSALIVFLFARKGKSAIISAYFAIISAGIMVGLITGSWGYIVPMLCLFTGLLFLLPIWKREENGDDIPSVSIERRKEELINVTKEIDAE